MCRVSREAKISEVTFRWWKVERVRDPDAVAVLANAAFQNVSHAKLLCARVSGQGSGGEIGHQLYKKFGAGKLDGVDFQSVPTDEAERAGDGFWRLDAALATLE